jgi:hypothetical protein
MLVSKETSIKVIGEKRERGGRERERERERGEGGRESKVKSHFVLAIKTSFFSLFLKKSFGTT